MIIVVGSRGQLGSAILQELGLMKIESCSFDLDITKTENIMELSAMKAEVIINCAAMTDVDLCETDIKNWNVNAFAPSIMANVCSAKFVQISSDYVFGESPPQFGYQNIPSYFPISEYGKAKTMAEIGVKSASNRNLIIRVQNLCSEKKGIVRTFANMTKLGTTVRLTNGVVLKPTSVYLAARSIVRAIMENKFGYYNYAPKSSTTIDYLWGYISGGKEYVMADDTRKAPRVLDSVLEPSGYFTDLNISYEWTTHVNDILSRIRNEKESNV